MFSKHVSLCAFACILSAVPLADASARSNTPNMKEGRWEMTAKMEMPGAPVSLPPVTFSQCLTREDFIPRQDAQESSECKITSHSMKGDTVSWNMVCDGAMGKTTSSGSITYKGESFTGTIMIRSEEMPEITQHLSGRRTGDCK